CTSSWMLSSRCPLPFTHKPMAKPNVPTRQLRPFCAHLWISNKRTGTYCSRPPNFHTTTRSMPPQDTPHSSSTPDFTRTFHPHWRSIHLPIMHAYSISTNVWKVHD